MTTHPTMTPTFESAMLSFSPGVNSRAELVTLASSGTKNYGLKDKASLFLNDVFSLDFCVFILKRQRRRIHCLYSRSSLCLKNDCIFIIQNIKEP